MCTTACPVSEATNEDAMGALPVSGFSPSLCVQPESNE